MPNCSTGDDLNATRLLVGALVVLVNTISTLVVIISRRNGNAQRSNAH